MSHVTHMNALCLTCRRNQASVSVPDRFAWSKRHEPFDALLCSCKATRRMNTKDMRRKMSEDILPYPSGKATEI